MHVKLIDYLSNRRIAPILHNSTEKDDLIALKLMCIIDYYTEQGKLYSNIEREPKLLTQLMQFKSYGSFTYYDCIVDRVNGECLLQCEFCEFIGSYALVLTHMAINHNAHISNKMCAYCKRKDVVTHSENTLQNCYENYLKKHSLRVDGVKTEITFEFFKILKNIAKRLKVIIIRNDFFTGTEFSRIESVGRKIQNFPTTCTVFF